MLKNEPNSAIVSCLLLIILAAYIFLLWPALTGPFLFDDFPNLQNLENINGDLSWLNLGKYLAAFTGSPGRPLSAISFLINDNAWPTQAYSFKYTNVLIHLINAVLIFGLLRQLANASPALPKNIFWPLLAMTAWIFHPIQISAQMLVVQRMTMLSATFCIAGLWFYTAQIQRTKNTWDALLAMAILGIFTILAFLSKENGALLPLFALILNVTLLQDLIISKAKIAQRLIFYACIIPTVLVFAAMCFEATLPNAYISRTYDLSERVITQAHVVSDYLLQIFIPRISGSGIYHDDYPIYRSLIDHPSSIAIGLIIISIITFALIYRKKHVLLSFSILWFFAGHVMESSILPLEIYFEHRNYLPLLGPVIAISAIPFHVRIRKKLAYGLLAAWMILLASITALQAPVWGNEAMIATFWAKENPMSLRATQQLAKYYYDNGQYQEASDELLNAFNSGLIYADLPMSALITKCWRPEVNSVKNLYQITHDALEVSPFSNGILKNIMLLKSSVESESCNETITSEQWLELTDSMLRNPKFLKTSERHIRIERAKHYIHERNLDLTMRELELAYKADPSVELTQKIAEVLLSAGLIDEAEAWLQKGLLIRQPYFDKLMYDPKQYSRKLLAQIDGANHRHDKSKQ